MEVFPKFDSDEYRSLASIQKIRARERDVRNLIKEKYEGLEELGEKLIKALEINMEIKHMRTGAYGNIDPNIVEQKIKEQREAIYEYSTLRKKLEGIEPQRIIAWTNDTERIIDIDRETIYPTDPDIIGKN